MTNPQLGNEASRTAGAGERTTLDPVPITPRLGAELPGIDLAQPLSAEAMEAIRRTFRQHPVLVLRNQHLGEADLHRFALVFGDVEGHAMKQRDGIALAGVHRLHNLEAEGKLVMNPLLSTTYFWHSDKSFLREPSLATILHAVRLPPQGGDTQFADMTKAYAALGDATKRKIADLHVVQSLEYMRRTTGNAAPSEEERGSAPPVVHPLVRTHPETGEKSLYIGMYSSHVSELPETEGRALLAELTTHATAPRFVYTHVWQPGDVVAWDNRCLLHRAVANYELEKHQRVMMRVVVKGDVPY